MVRLVLIGILLLQGLVASGQIAGTVDVLRQSFSDLRHRGFQEKVYLHTDKSYYVGGEYIWFSVYRTDAATHLPGVYSRFVYVELYNERDVMVERLKVMERDGFFHGSMLLDRYLPEGRYTLRAYTYWMQNFDESFYFSKEIIIGNSMTYGVRPEVRWGKTAKGQDYAEIRIRDAEGNIFADEFLDCRMYHEKEQVRKDVEQTNTEGWARFPIRQKDKITSLRVQFLNKKPFEYQTLVRVPAENINTADIQFFPEGGALIAGLTSRVGIKAVGADGLGVEVYGSIFRDDDELVGGFASSHRGMGRFALQPEAGRRYYALVHLPWDEEKRVDLPVVEDYGIALRAEVQDSVVRYTCMASAGFQMHDDLFLLVHSRGVLLSVLPIEPGGSGSLPVKGLPAGIIHGVIADRQGHIYSDRLSFVYPEEKTSVAIQPDRPVYGSRDSVRLQLMLSGVDTLRCSVTVTDSVLAPPTRWSTDIVNYFLLTSDLKGFVEDPGWYFDSSLPRLHRERMLDLLLATQGWTRFDVGRVCRNERDSLPFFLELTQGFSGRIKNFWGKAAKNSRLYAVVPRINLLREVDVDEQGRFALNVVFPDSTTFVFQALSARNTKWVELYMDRDSLRPPLTPLLLPERIVRLDSAERSPELSGRGDSEHVKVLGHYYEHNRKIYMLEEAKVIRSRKKNTRLGNLEHIAEQILEARDIRDENITSLKEWFLSIPGTNFTRGPRGDTLFYGYLPSRRTIVHVYVNDFDLSSLFTPSEIVDVLNETEIQHVERIGYVVNSTFEGRFLAAFVYLKPGYSLYPKARRLDFMQFSPLGYHEPAAFYQPRYEVKEERLNFEPDERSTLYWNPTVRLAPGQPQVLKFYTSDREGPFRVVLEGVTEKGEVVRVIKSLTHKAGKSDRVIKL